MLLCPVDEARCGDDVDIVLLNPMLAFWLDQGARLNQAVPPLTQRSITVLRSLHADIFHTTLHAIYCQGSRSAIPKSKHSHT